VNDTEREEFRDYVAGRSAALLRTAYLLTGNRQDAEDLMQTALAKTYLAWGRIRDKRAIDGYVRRVMVNQRTSAWRRRRIDERPTVDLPEPRDAAGRDTEGDSHAERLALSDALWQALAELPRKQRIAVVLRYYEDLSEAETAATLGVSVGTVKSSVSRALSRLRVICLELGIAERDGLELPSSRLEASP
jgi:RNA polymerase sigma-70 factor (sigma-E family)